MEVSVMRHLPTPFSTYDPRPQYHHWESRKPFPATEKDQPPYRFYDYPSHQPHFRYPPSPPMERQNHTSLPPISTLLGNLRETQHDLDHIKRDAHRVDPSRIDPRLHAPPTPPSGGQLLEQRPPPLRQSIPAAPPPQPSPSYPTPHESRQGSASSYSSRSALHHHRLSSSSWSNSNSARAPSPQSAPPLEASARPLYPTPSLIPQRSVPEYSPRTPQSPPSASTASSHVSEHERPWQPAPHAQHPQYAPAGPPGYMNSTPPGSQALHIPPPSAPLSAQPPATHPDRYVCPQCAKAFSRPSSLRIHVHSHTGEKPFVCPHTGCGKAFSVRSNMKRHQRGCHVDGNVTKNPNEDVEMEEG